MKSFSGFSILVADADAKFQATLQQNLDNLQVRIECVSDKASLLRRLSHVQPNLVLLNEHLAGRDGLEILQQLVADNSDLKVAMLSDRGSIDGAIAATRFGAVDYLTKPVDRQRLHVLIDQTRERTMTARRRASATSSQRDLRTILGTTAPIRNLLSLIEQVAASDATVLVLGESGTGKELIARAIHEQSPRRSNKFVPLNAAALPRELVESTLFGHGKGAFTGADRMQLGCCEVADKGTLFLDEIGEMEVGLQAKLLRFLQERSFMRVGQSQLVSVDVRIVAATNRDPLEQIRRGQLREDLYYRLNVVPIVVPPLRDRLDDIPELAATFLARATERNARGTMKFTDEAVGELMRHDWPGNVRELENVVNRMALLNRTADIRAEDVRGQLFPRESSTRVEPTPAVSRLASASAPEEDLRLIERIEIDAIKAALESCNGNVRVAAKSLGLGHATVYRKMKRYELGKVRADARNGWGTHPSSVGSPMRQRVSRAC